MSDIFAIIRRADVIVVAQAAMELTKQDALEVLSLLDREAIEVWVDGGWGMDALLGYQSRSHDDLDIVVRESDVSRLTQVLGSAGFRLENGGRPFNFVMLDAKKRSIDVHSVVFDDAGNGLYGPQPEDGSGLNYPSNAFSGQGLIGNLPVRCMTAEFQIDNHRGRQADDRDIHDVLALHDRFGSPLPNEIAIQLVKRGYDAIDERYQPWADRVDPPLRLSYLERVVTRLGIPSVVVELGCGPGIPIGRFLAERCTYIGVDLSGAMLRQAAINVPGGTFIQADMTEVTFAEASIDLVVAFYSIIHVAREKQASLLRSIAGWLRPGGGLVATLGTRDNPGAIEPDWLGGGPMFWSGFDAPTNLKLVEEAGFVVQESGIVDQSELGNPVQFLWVLAERRSI